MGTTKTNSYYLFVFFCFGCLASCQKDQDPAATSATAQAYVDRIVGEMQKYSINRKTIDWSVFKQKVNDKLAGSQSIADTYPAIQLALTLLGDNHSSYMTSTGTLLIGVRSINCTDGRPTDVPATSKIGYVKITGFSGSGTEATNFAKSIQTAIRQADSDSIRGWIVDLRGNTGGNMWPMLAGVGPILGDGIAGYFIDPDGMTTSWSYQKGIAMMDQKEMVSVDDPYTLRRVNPKVAVLTNTVTVSSGEVMAISFKTRLNTRSFGTPTCGLSTANWMTVLSDGGILNLTKSTLADRTKKLYGNQVQPDEVAYPSTAVDNAIAWLLQ